eukprot:CAMPEP_0202686300 /NCGR_PEP_ID=MMETSP1385-20130828/2117_1 /ASSEMBLY_ACC=CAM_ASM_000861 /TAXON_ID=933848 /ORGANISM="Elphidium margaritaceum" /LENGTH=367 /DNA_ID=CAMNT_0049340851 /DNA_START=32 /DNA_END=1135 /DNA_ORIENTATION=-
MGACCAPEPQIIVINQGNPNSDADLAKIKTQYPNAKVKNVGATSGQNQSHPESTPLGDGMASSREGCPDAAPANQTMNACTAPYVPQPGMPSAPPEPYFEHKEPMQVAAVAVSSKSITEEQIRASLADTDEDSTARRFAKQFVSSAVELSNANDSNMVLDMELNGSTLSVLGMRNLTKKGMLERAIELDGAYGVPYFMLADCHDDNDKISIKRGNVHLILNKQQVLQVAADLMKEKPSSNSSWKKLLSKQQATTAIHEHSDAAMDWQFASKLLLQAVELEKAADSDTVMDMMLTDNGTTLKILGMQKKTKKEMIERAIELYGKFGTAFLMLADCYPDDAKITVKVQNMTLTMTKQQVVSLGRSLNEQ